MTKSQMGPVHSFNQSARKIRTTHLTNAQLLALAATQVPLTETPPPGTLIVLRYAVFRYYPGSTGFTAAGDCDLMIEWRDTSLTDASLVCLCDNDTGGIDFTGTTAKQILVPSAFPADTMATLGVSSVVGAGLQLDQVGTTEWTAGDGVLDVTVVYDVIKLW
jgi:hypothetical protein